MKIFPRLLEVEDGSETCSFKIKNSSADDRVLLFKIRRSEPKLLEFSPKFGIVEPGVTRHVSLQLTNPKISFARVLVKLAALKRSKLLEDFEASWQLASQKGVVKKVVDVRNLAFNGSENEEEDGFASLASEDIGDMRSPVLSPASQMEVMLEEEEGDGEDDETNGSGRRKSTTTRPRRVTDTTETDKEAESGSEKVIARPVAAPSPAPSVLSPTSQALLQDVGRDDDRDGGADLGRLLSESSTSAFTKKPSAAARSPTAKRERSSMTTLFACSRAKPVVASGHAGNQASTSTAAGGALTAIVIEVSGPSATDTVVAEALALRAMEKFDSRGRIAAIEVSEAPITSLSSSVSSVFGGSSDLDRMRAMMLEDHLKHLSVTSCPALRAFDASVNRFANLSSLDLSGNGIVTVEGTLSLPLLQRLDVSGNRISSLEFCTELRGLKTLVAKDNIISSIRAVQVLIPLSATLSTLNLAHNPICLDLRYASTVVNILPKLKLFDSRDLVALGRSYSRNPTPTRGGKDGPPPLPQDLSALDALLEAEAEADAVNRGLEQEFERRLKRAVKKRQSGGGRFAVSLSSSSGSDDDEDEAAVAVAAEKSKGQPKKRSSPARATVSTSRPSSAPNPQLFSAFSRSLPSASRSQSPPGGRQAASASASAAAEVEFSDHLMGHTKANRAKRISQRQGVVSHWPGHQNEGPSETPRKAAAASSAVPETKDEGEGEGAEVEEGEMNESRARNRSTSAMSALTNTTRRSSSPSGRRQPGGSTLLQETRAHILRMKAYGIARQEGEGQAAGAATVERDAASMASQGAQTVRVKRRADDRTLVQREEDARFGIWHPRYRVPKRTFGYSKPFLHSNAPEATTDGIPLFDKYVKRMRDGFEKLPTRGTFPRATKGLMAEWYPMDYTEVEAIRRQGYFHEVIGDTQKYSYRDLRSMEGRTAHPHDDVSVDKRGSTRLSPRKGDRRGRNVMHQSRQYKTFEGRRDTEPVDEYSDWRKWNPQHWTKYGNNDHAAEFEPGHEVEGMSGERSPRKVPTSRSSILDGSFQRHEASMSLDASDIRVTASWPKQSQQLQQPQQPQQRAVEQRATSQSWQGLVREQQTVQEDSQQREERQLSAYLSWLENAEGKKGEQDASVLHPRELANRPEQQPSPTGPGMSSLFGRVDQRVRVRSAFTKPE